MPQYSNARAMRALVRASLQAIIKSPSAIVFSIAFPLIFILVFGLLGSSNSRFSVSIAPAPGSDTANTLYYALHSIPVLEWMNGDDTAAVSKALKQNNIAATLAIIENTDSLKPRYSIVINAASSQMDKIPQLQSIINSVVQGMDPEIRRRAYRLAEIQVHESVVREYKMIDFILPGQLGFSLLAGSVFGTAFVFFNLRQTLVLKRFFATPVRREIIVISEGIARMIFQLLGAMIIIGVGHFAFGYTLINGAATFLSLLGISALGIIVFMGFGFIVSGIAKSDATIPPFANIVTLPQFLLAGTFFSITNFPAWLQPFCKMLPLTFLNDAMRKVAYDGAGISEIAVDLLCLAGWGIVLYVIAGRLFKWE